jgi:hypothetical protein
MLVHQAKLNGEVPTRKTYAPRRHVLRVAWAVLRDPTLPLPDGVRMIRRLGQGRFIKFRLPGPVQVSDSVPEPKTLSR